MKKDTNLLFTLLEKSEACPGNVPLVLKKSGFIYGVSHIALPSDDNIFPIIYEHIMMLRDLELAEVSELGKTQAGPIAASINRITAKGHDFLEEYRRNKISTSTQQETFMQKNSKGENIYSPTVQKFSQDLANLPHPDTFSRAETHLSDQNITVSQNMNSKKIFIGHGQSSVWRDLKDFIQDRLNLIPVEFNSVEPAGKSTQDRLTEMLDEADFAFIIMTAEDEDSEGNFHARANVIHEAGLFQGKLGFEKAIILLEQECTEFSNVHGLTQIRFPKNNITAVSEKIRKVLERENILPS